MKLVSDMGGFPQSGLPALLKQGAGDLTLYERTDYLIALGTSTFITLDQIPVVSQGSPLMIWKNGALLFYGTDYTVSGNIVTLSTAINDKFVVSYYAARMQRASALSPVLANFDLANLGTHAILSNANRTATSDATANWAIARTQLAHASGKRLFELQAVVTGSASGFQFGLIDALQTLNTDITAGAGVVNAFGIQTGVPTLLVKAATNAAFGSPKSWANGDCIQVALDATNNKIWVSRKRATSTTSLATVATGSVAFTTQASLVYPTGNIITATSASTGEWMTGTVTSYSGTTLTVTMTACSGSGTHADWNIDGWIGGGSPDAGSTPTLTYTGAVTWYGALAVNGSGSVAVQGIYNGAGSFVLTPQNAATYTPWDN